MRTNRRKLKRYLNHLSSKLKFGMYFEDCNYHPSQVTRRNIFKSDMCGSDIEGVSLVSNSGTCCSIYHCAPWPMSKEMAEKQMVYLQQEGNSYADEAFKELTFKENEPHHLMKLSRRLR